MSISHSTRGIKPARAAEHLGVSTEEAISAQVKLLDWAEAHDRLVARTFKRLECNIRDERREFAGPKNKIELLEFDF